MKIIDLSHTIHPAMTVYPGTLPPVFEIGTTVEKDGFRETRITFYTHTGTHLDCPSHIFAGTSGTHDTPIGRFFGKGTVIPCTTAVKTGIIDTGDLSPYKEKIAASDFVLFNTGWDRYWGTGKYFEGFPTISAKAAELLINAGIKGIGIDAISFDPVDEATLPIHRMVLKQGIVLIENLTGLKNLAGAEFYFSCLPLKIHEGDGSPVRAAGILF